MSGQRLILSAFVVFLFLIGITATWAVWTNNGVPIAVEDEYQLLAEMTTDGATGAILTWRDERDDDGDIYAQRIDANGDVQWAVNGIVVCDATDEQTSPRITHDGAGGALIIWIDSRNSPGSNNIYGQRLDGTGSELWLTDGIRIFDSMVTALRITSDGAGGAIIVYKVSGNHLYAQRVDGNGNTLWPAAGITICDAEPNGTWVPVITSDGASGAIIAWQDWRNDESDLYAQRVDLNGNVLWTTNGVLLCDERGTKWDPEDFPQIISDGASGAIITWPDDRDDTNSYDIFAQRVDASGAVQWASGGVFISNAPGWDERPRLASDGTGGAIITWSSDGGDIYAQRIDGAGNVLWVVNGIAISTLPSYDEHPEITHDGEGGGVITWRSGGDIYAQWISSIGNIQWAPNGVIVCDEPKIQLFPQIMYDGVNGVYIVWDDLRNDTETTENVDIFAYRLELDKVVIGLDIKPGSCPNPFNMKWLDNTNNDMAPGQLKNKPKKGGVLPVAVIGSETFDVTEIDVSTLLLEGVSPSRHNYADVTRPPVNGDDCACAVGGADGYTDLTLKFSRKEIANAIGSASDGDEIVLTLTGTLLDGSLIEGRDCIITLRKEPAMPLLSDGEDVVLGPPSPNPCNPTTTISFSIPEAGWANLAIYNLEGKLVKTLVNRTAERGVLHASWDGTDQRGNLVASGVYFCRLKALGKIVTQKIHLVK